MLQLNGYLALCLDLSPECLGEEGGPLHAVSRGQGGHLGLVLAPVP